MNDSATILILHELAEALDRCVLPVLRAGGASIAQDAAAQKAAAPARIAAFGTLGRLPS